MHLCVVTCVYSVVGSCTCTCMPACVYRHDIRNLPQWILHLRVRVSQSNSEVSMRCCNYQLALKIPFSASVAGITDTSQASPHVQLALWLLEIHTSPSDTQQALQLLVHLLLSSPDILTAAASRVPCFLFVAETAAHICYV